MGGPMRSQLDPIYYEAAPALTGGTFGQVGAKGDFLSALIIIPANASPGAVLIQDGGESPITVFTGGATSVDDLTPIVLPLRMKSRTGGWLFATGADVSVIAVGQFT